MRAVNESNARERLPANTKRIILREGYFGDISQDEEMGPVIRRVTLRAKVLATAWQMVGGKLAQVATEIRIMPHTPEDERLIARHCEKMDRLGVDPVKRLIAPPAAGIPFLPDNFS